MPPYIVKYLLHGIPLRLFSAGIILCNEFNYNLPVNIIFDCFPKLPGILTELLLEIAQLICFFLMVTLFYQMGSFLCTRIKYWWSKYHCL